MRLPRPSLLRTGSLLVATAVAATLSLGGTSSADAEPARAVPRPAAATKTLAFGDAYMGWKQRPVTSLGTSAAPALSSSAAITGVLGIDVSRWQGDVNWKYWTRKGKQFAFVKATEGTTYRNPFYGSQSTGSSNAGLIHGAYHFAAPSSSSGKAQAKFFVAHGGGWERDGRTLPGVLDIEYNPYGSTCYGMTKKQIVAWVTSFTRKYKTLTGRDAIIYTNLDWWSRCAGNSEKFNQTNPLWVARYAGKVGTLPGAWPFYTFWQYTSSPLDQDRFSGKRARLVALAKG